MKTVLKCIGYISLLAMIESCGSENERGEKRLFELLNQNSTGVDFSNTLTESDSINYFTYPYLYMGGGVSMGDVNNDGLIDIYFTGNMVGNKLYLNKGNMKFDDITVSSGVEGDNSKWITGSTMGDVNGDGFLDIYVSVAGVTKRKNNLLYINNGDNTFTERAAELGVDDVGGTIQSVFFDYDLDGDLDLYVANYPRTNFSTSPYTYRWLMDKHSKKNADRFYRNDTGSFVDITSASGLENFGLSIGVVVGDLDKNGWPDIYISNDFQTPDYTYFNNGDGTFTEASQKITRHTAMYGMGVDAADINNDGLLDLFQVDMTPEDNRRSKANMSSMNPDLFWSSVKHGLHYQYMKNSLQINQGMDEMGYPVYSDVAGLAGISNTDWSWGALVVDLDNDGWKDLFVSNGTRRDINNKDYFASIEPKSFGKKETRSKLELSLGIPSEKVNNYAFRNNTDLTFTNVISEWGLDFIGFSNGVSYADLDNDGDIDLVISNMDSTAALFENHTNEMSLNNYLRIRLIGEEGNPFGIGAKVNIKCDDLEQFQELTLTRGYQSSVEPIVHFGLGDKKVVDEIVITWPDGSVQNLGAIDANQLLSIEQSDASLMKEENAQGSTHQMFENLTEDLNIDFVHKENDFDDYAFEPLLPHKTSNFGSGVAVGDVNGDGLEDFFVGGAYLQSGQMYHQDGQGKFVKADGVWQKDKLSEDIGTLLFDADGDGDNDLYVVSGGNEFEKDSEQYRDRLYINDGSGGFVKSENSLPSMHTSGSRVVPADYDGDGDIDLFVGGRLVPRRYPLPARSYILRNDSKDGNIEFVDVTGSIAPQMMELGLVTDAIWVDFDNDQSLDLVVTGEWMPITIFKNESGNFVDKTEEYGFDESVGWWFSIESGDFDMDGDIDFVAGNLGLNYKYQASLDETFDVYVSDYDTNGSLDIVLGYYNDGIQYPVRGRQCSSQQVPSIKNKFENYDEFAVASLEDVYTEAGLSNSLHYQASTFASSYIENKGEGIFDIRKLPNEAQVSSVNDIIVDDFDLDGNLDLMIIGNLYASEVETPRNDASIGLYLKGNGKGGFSPLSLNESGLYVKGDAKEAKSLIVNKRKAIVIVHNNDKLQVVGVNQIFK